jgi:hypothetical protein
MAPKRRDVRRREPPTVGPTVVRPPPPVIDQPPPVIDEPPPAENPTTAPPPADNPPPAAPLPDVWVLEVSKQGGYGDLPPITRQYVGTEEALKGAIARAKATIVVQHMCMCLSANPSESYSSHNFALQMAYYSLRMAMSAYRNALPIAPSRRYPMQVARAEAERGLQKAQESAVAQLLQEGVEAANHAYADYFGTYSEYNFVLRRNGAEPAPT